MKKIKMTVAAFAALVAANAAADVLKIADTITVDGKLDEAVWAKAKWEGDFVRLKQRKQGPISGPTKFAVLADAKTLYVGVKADQGPNMEMLRKAPVSPIFNGDDIEVFLSPSGSSFMFYQFAAAVKGGVRKTIFHYESGATHPDPYAPEWKCEVVMGESGYTMEFAIPLSALYMDRNGSWSDEWLFNVARSNFSCPGYEFTSWSPLKTGFPDVDNFRKLKGFPMRRIEEDVCLREAAVTIQKKTAEGLAGEMKVKAFVAKPGAFAFESPYCTTTAVELKCGENSFTVPCRFPKNATYQVPLTLVRKDDGTRCSRGYPVFVDFDSIRIKLTTPGYADNFYPGQSTARIAGTVACALEGKLEIVAKAADGQTVGRVTPPMPKGDFTLDLPAAVSFPVELTASCAGETRTKLVKKIEPNGHRMAWIENGVIVVDGKPIFRRNFYGGGPKGGYRCGKRFLKRMQKTNLYLTEEVTAGPPLSNDRVANDETESRKDEPPSREFMALIDKQLEKAKGQDFVFYYLADEPECRSISPVYLKYVYDYVKARDPYHLILIVSRGAEKYIDCSDWIESHGYLDPYYDDGVRKYFTPMNRMGAFLEDYIKQGRKDKVIGATPQAFTYSMPADYPTFDEYVCNIWTFLVNGAKSLYPFIFNCVGERPSLEEAVKFTEGTIADLEEILLFGERKRLVRTHEYECATWNWKGEKLFAVVNLTEKPQTVKVAGIESGSYREYRGHRTFQIGAGETMFALKPFEVIAGTSNPKRGTMLPTLAEFAETAAAREYVRLHRDNQILMKQREIEISSSASSFSKVLLVNGVYDDCVSDTHLRGGNPWIEMAFPKGAIEFKSVRLWGDKVERATVLVRVKGEWQELKPTKRTFDESLGCLTLDFSERVKTVKVRFEFHRDNVEPSEIEFPHCGNCRGNSGDRPRKD